MNNVAEYLIAQHIADLFRREPRNIGVFVRIGGNIAARFFAESDTGKIDRRKSNLLPYPDVYEQWVSYWRRTLAKEPDAAWSRLIETAHDNYRVIDGGQVDGTGGDGIGEVTDFLYAALVSESGIASAFGAPDESEAAIKLADAIGEELRRANLLMEGNERLLTDAKYPVRRNIPVEGRNATHIFTFYQENGHKVVIEPIDLMVKRDKKRMKERAGWASCVFEDVRKKESTVQAIAIVSATAAEEREESADYALKLLRPRAEIINWLSDVQRRKFLDDRASQAV
jgi:hypothetical protein